MSKYTELREILKEDIEAIVEQRLAERMESIIESLMPSILEHVAQNLQVFSGPTMHGYEPGLIDKQLTIQTEPGHTRYVSVPFTTVDKQVYTARWQYLDKGLKDAEAAYQTLNIRLNNLEFKLP